MATVQVLKGIVAPGGIAFTPDGAASQSLSIPNNTGVLDGSFNAMRVTAIDSAVWLWWTGDGSTDPRIYLPLGGSIDFSGNFRGKTLSAKAYP